MTTEQLDLQRKELRTDERNRVSCNRWNDGDQYKAAPPETNRIKQAVDRFTGAVTARNAAGIGLEVERFIIGLEEYLREIQSAVKMPEPDEVFLDAKAELQVHIDNMNGITSGVRESSLMPERRADATKKEPWHYLRTPWPRQYSGAEKRNHACACCGAETSIKLAAERFALQTDAFLRDVLGSKT